jgi:hypothetical protein
MGTFNIDERTFRVGILTESLEYVGQHAVFISNPASACFVTAVALTSDANSAVPPPPLHYEGQNETIRSWCKEKRLVLEGEEVAIMKGEDGYDEMLARDDVDAVYIAVPCLQRKDFLPRALKAGKHVLVDYPVCASIPEFLEMIRLAHRHGKHLQDSTLYIHHHRISELLDCIFDEEQFGKVKSIHETLNVNHKVPDPITTKSNPEWKEQGAVGTLAR